MIKIISSCIATPFLLTKIELQKCICKSLFPWKKKLWTSKAFQKGNSLNFAGSKISTRKGSFANVSYFKETEICYAFKRDDFKGTYLEQIRKY